jgi:hypothetical protein
VQPKKNADPPDSRQFGKGNQGDTGSSRGQLGYPRFVWLFPVPSEINLIRDLPGWLNNRLFYVRLLIRDSCWADRESFFHIIPAPIHLAVTRPGKAISTLTYEVRVRLAVDMDIAAVRKIGYKTERLPYR